MTKRISLFNHKGGVSKTTTTFHLGWMLASKGKRVILVDADPQCNLTGLVMGHTEPNDFEDFYKNQSKRNIRDGLAPAFESRPEPIKPVDCIPISGIEGLFILPGHIRLSEYEVTLGIAQELSGTLQTLQNLPGAISALLDMTARKFNADYILIDMNPSLSSINQNLVMTSDYFIVPTSPDYFWVMAIASLATVLPKWYNWAQKAQNSSLLQDAAYPFPKVEPKFLGTIIQKFRPRQEMPTVGFQRWIDEINNAVDSTLLPALSSANMLLPIEFYAQFGIDNFCLAMIADFNTLIATSQKFQMPVFALTPKQVDLRGSVLENTMKKVEQFRDEFSQLADAIIGLTNYANSPQSVSG